MKKRIILLTIFLFAGCEKMGKTSYSKYLMGQWDGVKKNYTYSVLSNQSQTAINPYESGTGMIEISGAESASLTYMYIYSTNGVLQISMAKNAFDVPSEETNYLLNIYDYGDFGSFSQLTVTARDYSATYEGELTFTVHSIINGDGEITIQPGALYHNTTNDSVMVSGTLAPVQVAIEAGTDYELGNMDWNFTDFDIEILIDNDKTFKQNVTTINGEVFSDSGTWDANDKEITLYFENRTRIFQYSVTNSNLELKYVNDLCVLTPDECLPQYELMYGMESGSLEQVILLETTHFSKFLFQ